jgi:hypothetical protein
MHQVRQTEQWRRCSNESPPPARGPDQEYCMVDSAVFTTALGTWPAAVTVT